MKQKLIFQTQGLRTSQGPDTPKKQEEQTFEIGALLGYLNIGTQEDIRKNISENTKLTEEQKNFLLSFFPSGTDQTKEKTKQTITATEIREKFGEDFLFNFKKWYNKTYLRQQKPEPEENWFITCGDAFATAQKRQTEFYTTRKQEDAQSEQKEKFA